LGSKGVLYFGNKELNDYMRSQHSINVNALQRLTPPIAFDQLVVAIRSNYKFNYSKKNILTHQNMESISSKKINALEVNLKGVYFL